MNVAAINKLRRSLVKRKLDALLITKAANVAYLSGARAEAQLIITQGKQFLITDFRFFEQAAKEANLFQIWQRQNFQPFEASILGLVKKLKLRRLGFEATALSCESYRKLQEALKPVRLLATINIVEQLRAIKNAQEVKFLKRAAVLAVKSLAFAQRIIEPGKTEARVSAEVQYFMKRLGAENSAFEIIVASGKRSSWPHAPVSSRTIRDNEAVLVDLGCRISGYNSDLTRMVFLGKISCKIKRIYEIVIRAQQQAIKAIRAGVKICQIDKIARQHIAEAGFAAFFGHALGHGIGREVHEDPTIFPKNQQVLKKGMVFTVEPAVYIPGCGGIRVEDMVLVTKSGCEILTKINHRLEGTVSDRIISKG